MRKEFVSFAVLVLMLLLTGCEAADRQLIIDLALSWAAENAVAIGTYTFFGRSGDTEVDAVMGARDVINNITAADQLMEEGREEKDLDKMEQAIEKRPGDYTYRVSYGTALLQAGDTAAAERQFTAAHRAVEDYGEEHAQRYAVQGIDELGALRPGFEKNGFVSVQQCHSYHWQLAHYYGVRYTGTGQAYFKDQYDHNLALGRACQ